MGRSPEVVPVLGYEPGRILGWVLLHSSIGVFDERVIAGAPQDVDLPDHPTDLPLVFVVHEHMVSRRSFHCAVSLSPCARSSCSPCGTSTLRASSSSAGSPVSHGSRGTGAGA